jgi:hypothetical protein
MKEKKINTSYMFQMIWKRKTTPEYNSFYDFFKGENVSEEEIKNLEKTMPHDISLLPHSSICSTENLEYRVARD